MYRVCCAFGDVWYCWAMFNIDNKSIKRLEADLKAFAHRALPFATKSTLNMAAFDAQKEARATVSAKMVERNKFTRQSIRVDQAKTLNVRRQESAVGSIAEYMADQEFGGVKASKGKHGVAIATSFSAGQQGQRPRTRLPRKPNKLANIRLKRGKRTPANKRQRTLFAVQDAVSSGNRTVFLDLGRTKGIFRVVGGRKGFKRGWPKGARLKMLHDMSNKSVRIPRNPWLAPATKRTEKKIPGFYRKAIIFQLKRKGLFRSR